MPARLIACSEHSRPETPHPVERGHYHFDGSGGGRLRPCRPAHRGQDNRVRRPGPELLCARRQHDRRRCERNHLDPRDGRLSPSRLGRPNSRRHSQQRDHRRLHGSDPSRLRTVLPAGRHVRRQPHHGAGLHRCGHHLLHRQFAQLAFVGSLRRSGTGAARFRRPRRACVRRANVRGMGSAMAARREQVAAPVLRLR